jgi:hypothetical protein
MKKIRHVILFALGALLFHGYTVAPARADEQAAQSAKKLIAQDVIRPVGQSCTLNLVTKEYACYATYTEALAAVTDGLIIDGPADSMAARNDERLAARIDALGETMRITSGYVLAGTFWWDWHYEGQSLLIYGNGCTATTSDVDDYFDLTGNSFNDQISSFQGANGCWIKAYEHQDKSGKSVGFTSSVYSLDDYQMNDMITFIEFS